MLIARIPRAVSMALVPITRTCVHDAAGRLRPLYRIRKRWRSGADRAELPDDVRGRLIARIGPPRSRASLIAGTVPLCVLIVLAALAPGLLGLSAWILYPVIAVAVCMLLAQLAASRPPPVQRERIVLELLKEGRCPSCAYPLRAADGVGDDRLATCSECGAVWWRQV